MTRRSGRGRRGWAAAGALALLLCGAAQGTAAATTHEAPAAATTRAARVFYGGETMTDGGGDRCTAGYVATGAGSTDRYILTAANCTDAASTWYTDDGVLIGESTGTGTVGYGLVRVANPDLDARGAVLLDGQPVDVTGSTPVPVGSQVCAASGPSGTLCGTVTAYDVTVSLPDGTVTGLTQTTLCTGPADIGAPVLAGGEAQGVVVGGSGCTTFVLPVDEALTAFGVELA
ncbi:S1 family peptidase [Streptomyces sp. NPDC050560]|uniref:S1 family peptidase n=1 Tax=Streptomyces sp. NPDC050560 TaxID=3365630 RepID=UPI0037A60E53